MKVYFSVTLAASLLLLATIPAQAGQDDQSLEPVFLAATEEPAEGIEQVPTLDTTENTRENTTEDTAPAPTAAPMYSNSSANGPQLSVATTKIGIPIDRVGSFATIVTKDQIRQMQANSVLDVLKRVPGVDVAQNGGPGQTASIFIRGMNAEHTLVLVDGIEVNDPISPGRTFNFPDQISVDSIDRVEVLRGPQSQLYGSDAIGGVINIITDMGSGKPSVYVKSQGGSYGTIQNDVDLRGGLAKDTLRFTMHAMQQRTAGFSTASSRYGNRERDPFHATALSGQVAYHPFQNVSLNFLSRYGDSKASLDNQGGFGGDDPNYVMRNKMLLLGASSRVTLQDGRFEQISRISVNSQWRKNTNDPDPAHPFNSEHSRYSGQLMKIDVQNNYQLNKMNKLMGGVEIGNQRGNLLNNFQSQFGPFTAEVGNHTATNVSLYFQDYIKLTDRWFTTVGARWDEYNRFGHATTYRGATNYVIPETGTTFRASYGTGFKAPTLYQMYALAGQSKLNAEKSQGWDTGVEQKLFKDKFLIGATYYHNHLNNWINYNTSTFIYNNIGNARMMGSEVYSTWTPNRRLTAKASYTATYARDLDHHEGLLRRPHHKYSFNINYQPTEKLNLNVDITHVGNAMDLGAYNAITNTTPRVTLGSYTLLNLALSYKLSKNCTLFGRLVNLLDTPYESVKGYGNPRISAYGGLQLGI